MSCANLFSLRFCNTKWLYFLSNLHVVFYKLFPTIIFVKCCIKHIVKVSFKWIVTKCYWLWFIEWLRVYHCCPIILIESSSQFIIQCD